MHELALMFLTLLVGGMCALGQTSAPPVVKVNGVTAILDALRKCPSSHSTNLDDESQTYVPAFPKKEWPVTLRQWMGHVAGVRHYRHEVDYLPSAHCERAG